ncbi:MAG: VTT domain-containing protein [Planctomycetota bacterium]
MRRLLVAGSLVALLFLALWAVLVASGVEWVSQPPGVLERGGWIGASVGVALLALDVVAPVPASIVMVVLGKLYGFGAGAALSLAGSVLSALLAWLLGRRGEHLLARWMSPAELRSADAWLARHGAFALAVTRPVPILAETFALLAGARAMPLGRVLVAATLGILPAALLYAWAGSAGRDVIEDALLFGLTLVIAGALWLAGRRQGSA